MRPQLVICCLAAATFSLTACKKEQVMYEEKEEAAAETSKKPPATAATEAAPADPHGMTNPHGASPAGANPHTANPHGGGAPGSGTALPAPPVDRATLAADVATATADVAGVTITIPATWQATPADKLSPMRAAEFSIPPVTEGERGAIVAGFNFGVGQGGDVASNVSRWLGQIEITPPATPILYQSKAGSYTVTEVIADGTLKPSTMGPASGPADPQPNSQLYGVIIDGGPKGLVFLKITGDAETVRAAHPAIATLVQKLK